MLPKNKRIQIHYYKDNAPAIIIFDYTKGYFVRDNNLRRPPKNTDPK